MVENYNSDTEIAKKFAKEINLKHNEIKNNSKNSLLKTGVTQLNI